MEGEQDEYVSFSIREGVEPRKAIQWQSMDDPLRAGLWNALTFFFWQHASTYILGGQAERGNKYNRLLVRIWINHMDLMLDDMPQTKSKVMKDIRQMFIIYPWNRALDFLEFVSMQDDLEVSIEDFRNICNIVFRKNRSAYRFTAEIITPITSESEIATIEDAIAVTARSSPLQAASHHLHTALEHLSRRDDPDYRNSVKESISAVEVVCKRIAGTDEGVMRQALSTLVIRKQFLINKDFRTALEKLYDYTSGPEGIRHAMMEDPGLDVEDARFMLVTCSAFVNYLLVKADKAGISLTTTDESQHP